MVLHFSAGAVRAQDYISYFRGDEVGPRTLELDEETFLNILSFEQPLETIQPWLASNSGYRVALGSLSGKDLWMQQELKHFAPVSDKFGVRVFAGQGIDLDTDHVFIQTSLEYKLNQRLEAFMPAILDADKGSMDGGLGLRYSDRDNGIDYLQFAWVRSDVMFNERSRNYGDSRIREDRDLLEAQAQAPFFNLGKTSLKVLYQIPSDVIFEEDGREEEFERFSAWLLHNYEFSDMHRFFFKLEYDSADESIDPLVPATVLDAFAGDRNAVSTRLEYQMDLSEDGIQRWRGGVQYIYYHEDEDFPADPVETHEILRRETTFYGGYRTPLGDSKDLSLETMVYLAWMNNHNRWPGNDKEDSHDPTFQGKISGGFLWTISEKAEFMIGPSFELDEIGWAGGAIQLRCSW